MQTEPTARISIYASHAQQDQTLQQELKEHLRPLQQQGHLSLWSDTESNAGAEWEQEIDQYLNAAQIILLLVSSAYLNSDNGKSVEMKRAMERFHRGDARVIPIILDPCDWKAAPLGRLQVLPKGGKPVTAWSDREEAWRDVVDGLSHVVDETLHQPKRA